MYFSWTCPDCGHENCDSIDRAEVNSCRCSGCGREYEVYFSVEVTVEAIRPVN